MLNGYFRDGIVYINRDLAGGDASLLAGAKALSDRLLKVALEEIAHHTTQSTDNLEMAVEKKASLAAKKSASGLGVTWVRRVVRVCGFATYMDVLGEAHGYQNGRERTDSKAGYCSGDVSKRGESTIRLVKRFHR